MTMRRMLADKVEVNYPTAIPDVDCGHPHHLFLLVDMTNYALSPKSSGKK
jgi:hypothetical protein